DVEFPVDAFGMGAYRAQGDHELIGDLWSGKLSLEQAEHIKLTLSQWLYIGLRGGGVGQARFVCALLAFSATRRQQSPCIPRHDSASGGFVQQAHHGWAFVHERANVVFWLSQRQGAFQRDKSSRDVALRLAPKRLQRQDFDDTTRPPTCFR